ncbi:MAG: hypothetical protein SNJ56_03965, partial [Termitinemataceae bacterium]
MQKLHSRFLFAVSLLWLLTVGWIPAFGETGAKTAVQPDRQSVPIPHRILPNGLEVFVVENHTVPLVTICVAFRGGALAQTPENSGLFHLYEHM